MSPGDRDRLAKCLALAARGATAGERAAAKAAAERIAASAGLTLAEAKARIRGAGATVGTAPPHPRHARQAYAWAKPKEPPKPVTVEELLRAKAETAAWRKRQAAAADRRLLKELEEQEVWAAEARAAQAERDREWAARRSAM